MSRRANVRCDACHMHVALCICDLVPDLETRTKLVLLVHYREARKPTNTGQLAARCVRDSVVEIIGDRPQPVAPADGVLLYPANDAVPIAQIDRPVALIVPDGNWRQAGKMRQRIPGLAALPCVTIDAAISRYQLRAERRSGGLATLEAIAAALRVLEGDRGPELEAAMLAVFRAMVERTLWLRGTLRDHEVSGGIPAAALARDPRGTRTL